MLSNGTPNAARSLETATLQPKKSSRAPSPVVNGSIFASGSKDVAAAGAAATSPHTEDPHGGDPHGHGAGAQGGGTTDENGIFQPPPDTAEPDATLPAGTIRILVRDPDGKPLPGTVVTIGIIIERAIYLYGS